MMRMMMLKVMMQDYHFEDDEVDKVEDDDGDEAGSTSSWEAGGSIHPDSMIMKHSEE